MHEEGGGGGGGGVIILRLQVCITKYAERFTSTGWHPAKDSFVCMGRARVIIVLTHARTVQKRALKLVSTAAGTVQHAKIRA